MDLPFKSVWKRNEFIFCFFKDFSVLAFNSLAIMCLDVYIWIYPSWCCMLGIWWSSQICRSMLINLGSIFCLFLPPPFSFVNCIMYILVCLMVSASVLIWSPPSLFYYLILFRVDNVYSCYLQICWFFFSVSSVCCWINFNSRISIWFC